MTCEPTASLAEPSPVEYECDCREKLVNWPGSPTDWQTVDTKGRRWHDDNAPAWVAECQAHPDGFWAGLAERDMNMYSNLRAYHSLLAGGWPWRHAHRAVRKTSPDPGPDFVLPWCCDEPMYACPAGWQCRVRKTIFPYQTAS